MIDPRTKPLVYKQTEGETKTQAEKQTEGQTAVAAIWCVAVAGSVAAGVLSVDGRATGRARWTGGQGSVDQPATRKPY